MKIKLLGIAALAAMALMAFASTASATTLELGGVAQNKAIKIIASLSSSALFSDTVGTFDETCGSAILEADTEKTFTSGGSAPIGGPVTSVSFASCTQGTIVIDAFGTLSIEWIKSTTNGTVRSNGLKLTIPGPAGTETCTTSNTDIGVLTGVKSGKATLDINAVLICNLSSAKWSGTYVVTSPEGLGVVE